MQSSLPTLNLSLARQTGQQNALFGTNLAYAKVEDGTCYLLSPRTSCKDYITDSMVWIDEDYDLSDATPGGWNFKGEYDKENTTLFIANSVKEGLGILNEYEDSVGVELTKGYPIATLDDGHQGAYAVVGDKFWSTTTIHFSMYMSLLRYLSGDVKGNGITTLLKEKLPYGNDTYVKPIWDRMRVLPLALKKLVVTIKRNAPRIEGQHCLNGHHCQLYNRPIWPRLTYYTQLKEIDPSLFVGRSEDF